MFSTITYVDDALPCLPILDTQEAQRYWMSTLLTNTRLPSGTTNRISVHSRPLFCFVCLGFPKLQMEPAEWLSRILPARESSLSLATQMATPQRGDVAVDTSRVDVACFPPPPPTATTADARWVQVEKSMLSRVLYPNPVCLLSVQSATDDPETSANVMTITWLTPINNQVCTY